MDLKGRKRKLEGSRLTTQIEFWVREWGGTPEGRGGQSPQGRPRYWDSKRRERGDRARETWQKNRYGRRVKECRALTTTKRRERGDR